MAEEGQTRSVASGDKPDGTLLRSGEVNFKGKEHKLNLTPKGLQLVESNDQQSSAGAAAAAVPVIDVEWIDVLCAREVPPNNYLQDISDSAFVIHYIHRKADNKLCCNSVTLDTKKESVQSWISQIMEKCKEGKPRKLLIIINPIGGKRKATQTFEKQVRHIFDLAGVEVIVKETERAQHAVEIAKSYDVSTIDGMIAMGGDGMYMEILHGLTVRTQEEEGIDFNDPDAKLVSPAVQVGYIPAGTGNIIAGWLNGIVDIETAVLNIIRGETGRMNIFAVFEPGKLIRYGGVLLSNGYYSAVLQRSEELRWMKRARYQYAYLEALMSKKKFMELNIEVLKLNAESKNKQDDSGDGAEAAASGWTKVGTRQVTAILGFPVRILDDGEKMEIAPFHSSFDMFLMETGSNWDKMKFMSRILNLKKSVARMDKITVMNGIAGIRFELVEQEQDKANAKQREEIAELCKLLNIDGELFQPSVPKFEVRLLPNFLQVYCAPALYDSKAKAET